MSNDKFNRPAQSLNYGRKEFTPVEWDDTTTDGVIYLRGDYSDSCIIQKVDNSAKTITWAYGAWANRANLTYGNDRLVQRG